ncbi:MAG: adenine phosphoribosyltransferase [Bacteroidetes bacterium]|jgi:adenine phosphoribosyltransferase|nr:adenine phosphoribosyltransferase [Bacteroidota bacterium]
MVDPSPDVVKALTDKIRTVPDFPKPGIRFKDITPILQDPSSLRLAVDVFARRYQGTPVDVVVGVESRGFILGAPLALRLGAGFVPVRKRGKLPAPVRRASYALEYGTDEIEMHADAFLPGARVLLHDDLLATGGTLGAAIELIRELGGSVVGVAVLVELAFLKGAARLAPHELFSVIRLDVE